MSSGYYCSDWVDNLDEDQNGMVIKHVWDSLCCSEWTGSETVYLNQWGDTNDRGDMQDESCTRHGHGDWVNDVYDEAMNTIINHGWYLCDICWDDNNIALDQTPIFATEEARDDHMEQEHDTPEVLAAQAAQVIDEIRNPQPTNAQIEEAIRGIPGRPTAAQIADGHRPYFVTPPISERLQNQIAIYFRGSYLTQYLDNPLPNILGMRAHEETQRFVMIRREADMRDSRVSPGWVVHRFTAIPPRAAARSTGRMWSET